MRNRLLIAALLLASPSLAHAQTTPSPPSVSQTSQDSVTVHQLLSIIAERDRLYSQRFDAQEKSTTVAFTAAQKAVDAALISTKESHAASLVAIKETAAAFGAQTKEHFAAINGLQAKLDKQAETFVNIKELRAVEDRMTRMEARGEGAGGTWVIIAAVLGPLLAAAALAVAAFVAFRRPARV